MLRYPLQAPRGLRVNGTSTPVELRLCPEPHPPCPSLSLPEHLINSSLFVLHHCLNNSLEASFLREFNIELHLQESIVVLRRCRLEFLLCSLPLVKVGQSSKIGQASRIKMPCRRPHRKSRLGCKTCKSRRTKVSLVKLPQLQLLIAESVRRFTRLAQIVRGMA